MLRSRSVDTSILDREADEPSGLVDSAGPFRLHGIDAGPSRVTHLNETTYVDIPRSCFMATALAARMLFSPLTTTATARSQRRPNHVLPGIDPPLEAALVLPA